MRSLKVDSRVQPKRVVLDVGLENTRGEEGDTKAMGGWRVHGPPRQRAQRPRGHQCPIVIPRQSLFVEINPTPAGFPPTPTEEVSNREELDNKGPESGANPMRMTSPVPNADAGRPSSPRGSKPYSRPCMTRTQHVGATQPLFVQLYMCATKSPTQQGRRKQHDTHTPQRETTRHRHRHRQRHRNLHNNVYT